MKNAKRELNAGRCDEIIGLDVNILRRNAFESNALSKWCNFQRSRFWNVFCAFGFEYCRGEEKRRKYEPLDVAQLLSINHKFSIKFERKFLPISQMILFEISPKSSENVKKK